MPETYVREMVVDFMATSKEKTGSYDITKWVNTSVAEMRLHQDTITRLNGVMRELGYSDF